MLEDIQAKFKTLELTEEHKGSTLSALEQSAVTSLV